MFAYWASNLVVDFVKALVPCVFGICMVYAYNIETFTETSDNQAVISLLFIGYAWAIISFSFLFGFLFKSYGNAQVLGFFVHFIFGGIMPLLIFILKIIKSTRDAGNALQWIFRLIPSFAFGDGVVNLGNLALMATIEGKKTPYKAWGLDASGAGVLYLFLEGAIYFGLIFVLE